MDGSGGTVRMFKSQLPFDRPAATKEELHQELLY
jgi:hypothetical protein